MTTVLINELITSIINHCNIISNLDTNTNDYNISYKMYENGIQLLIEVVNNMYIEHVTRQCKKENKLPQLFIMDLVKYNLVTYSYIKKLIRKLHPIHLESLIQFKPNLRFTCYSKFDKYNKIISSDVIDECPICLDIKCNTSLPICKHYLCYKCIDRISVDNVIKCPVCRHYNDLTTL